MDTQTNTQTNTQTTLTLGDVVLMHNIVATVSRRGAFEAEEFQVVGQLFEKLKALLPKTEEQGGTETTNTSEEVKEDDGQTQFEFVEN